MAAVRNVLSALAGVLVVASQLAAQDVGSVSGRVVDSTTNQPLANVSVAVEGTDRRAVSGSDGTYLITAVPVGSYRVRARRLSYVSQLRDVTVTAGGSATADFAMAAQAAMLSEVVVTGYGTQRREAISGSVSTINASAANVGLITNASQMLQGRVTGVSLTANNGEPGAGVQLRIRGGTSISASNEPLYVVDGVPLQNEEATPGAAGIANISPQLARNPLNSINPNDIESITILKDASATAIYGSRGANGVVLINTKRVAGGGGQMEYETYVSTSSATKSLGLASGAQYRSYVQGRVAAGQLPATAVANLGAANTDWEGEITRPGLSTSHNLSFSGGSSATQYRASLNYFNQQGVVIGNSLERYQGRLNATHDAFSGKLRLGLNMMSARVNNEFAPIENGGGFLGGLFTNMAIYNPTFPVTCPAGSTASGCVGKAAGSYYETGSGAQDSRNPVAMAELIEDAAPENRVLGNFSGTLSLRDNLTAQTTLGIDFNTSTRRTFAPRISPIGAQYNGYAQQSNRSLQNANFQQLLTYAPGVGADHEFEIVGGYEYSKIDNRGFTAATQGYITDAFGVDNLGAGTQASSPVPTSYRVESQLASFFSRANYGFAGKYFLTGVVRYDGSSRLAEGHRWATFPAVSASWRLSEEEFLRGGMFSTLALRAGWGKQGNQAVAPYQTKLLLRADPGAVYPFGGVLTTGLRASQVGNPDLKWETATQTNFGIDYGFSNERFTGVIDFYQKTTDDLLLEVDVPQPAVVNTRLENIGSIRNRGVEATFNTPLMRGARRTLNLELVASMERNEVTSIGERKFINSGFVSGQGQSGQYSQRIMQGEPVGTFFAHRFLEVNAQGQQVFSCKTTSAGCVSGKTTSPTDDDREVIGSANPDFSLGVSNNATWGKFDASWLWRAEFGGKVFNNTALVYRTKSNATQGRNFLASALTDPDAITEPAKFSDRWIEDRTFTRLQNLTIGYTFDVSTRLFSARSARVYVAGDNLLLVSDYSGYDPEVFVASGLASRGLDYLTYPRGRTFTLGARFQF
ncbi:MAG: SusC/RagA family TonB-linked outer membrane protein [Gemmatimonadota bacterium]